MATPTQQKILDALARNDTNLCAWAKANEYNYQTAWNTVMRWAGRDDRTPHGGIARLIMKDLAKYVDESEENNDTQIAIETPKVGTKGGY